MTKKSPKAENDKVFNDQGQPNLEAPKVEENKQIIEQIGDNFPSKEYFPIVGIGASAGGLEALATFFSNTIPNSGIAWIIVMHLDPTHESILSELIKKYTQMPVFQAEDNIEVKQDCIYVIPPNYDMAFKNNRLLLSGPTASRGLRLPIDFFFRSLLEEQKERAIGVILSGTGTDGTFGAREIKGVGGMIIVQDPETAKYDGMPRSVISTTVVDYILPPDKMSQQIIEYIQKHISNRILKPEGPSKDDVNYINQIFQFIHNRTGHDFSAYKINTLVRRIERRMMITQISIISDYIKKIQEDPKELRVLTKELIIGVTNFFRDKDAFQLLEEKIIPLLFQDRKSMDQPIRIWIPGCSTGEEAYSIAIIIQEHIEKVKQNFNFQIFATDIDASAIETARLGFFPENISVDVSPERLQRYFIQEKNFYQIIKPIRDKIVFAVQNIIRDPPFSKLDFISCRNLFIYLIPEVQKKLLSIFDYSLNEGGILFLGSSESMGEYNENFVILNQKWKLFQKKETKRPYKELIRPFPPLIGLPARTAVMEFSKVKEKLDYRKIMEGILIKEYAPASVIINHKNEIIYISGHTGKFLEPSAGEAKMDVTEMVRDDLKLELMNAIRKVTVDKMEYRREGLKVRSNGDSTYINLIVNPISEPPEMSDLILISFEEILPKEPKSDNTFIQGPLESGSVKIIKQLEIELTSTKQYLQTLKEEYETVNEELKSANEELQSSNEELQSTNEELQTSKEELQSINEELNTVNVELQSKINEISIVNNDLNNLISSTEIGTIFLDNRLNIKRFTSSVTSILNLIPTDIGRPLRHISSNLKYENLTKDAEAVLKTLIPKQFDVQTKENKWFSARIIPYRTQENVINGVVITFFDINERKQIGNQLKQIEWLLQTKTIKKKSYNPPYGDLLRYNTNGLIITSCGIDFLTDIVSSYLDLLDTSAAVYEINGDYALGIFSSNWCRTLDQASRNLIETPDNKIALESGKWLCHESCWTQASKLSIERGEPIDIECEGGLHIYACPIRAGNKFVGSINIGYGEPPKDLETLQKISDKFKVSKEKLLELSESYETRPAFIIQIAKSRLESSAKLIGTVIELKQVEKALRESEQKYRNFVEKAYEGVWAIDSNADTTFINPQMTKILGYSLNEMIGKSLFDFMAESEIKDAKEKFEKRKKGISEEHEFEFLRKNGQKIYTRLQTSPLFQEDGSFIGAIAYITDITDRKKADIMLKESEMKFREAYNRAEFYKDLFTHDINNILQNIGSPIEVMMRHQFPKEISKDAKVVFDLMKGIYDQFTRASQLVSNIRKLSKIDESTEELKSINIIEILNKSIEYIRGAYSKKVMEIKSEFIFDAIYVQADYFLSDVFENLMNNSIKHNESQIIEIQVKVNKILENNISYVKCEFIDNGEGIPDSLKRQIFNQPIRNRKGSGMGIGLTLVSKIISKYDGKISIEDRVSGDYTKGTNFIVLIPEVV